MAESSVHGKYEQVARRIDPKATLLRSWKLAGGVSAEVTALEIERADGRRQKMVVRRHGDVDLRLNPNIAADEFTLLQLLQSTDVAAPKPLFLDQSGRIFATPYLVIVYVEGKTTLASLDSADLLHQLTGQLVKIHGVNGSKPALAFLPRQTKGFGERPATLDESLNEGRIREVLETAWPLCQRKNRPALLHGDYWPGNLLWRDGQLAAVIDWEDAKLGDPLADVANARLELLWAYGVDAMDRFTQGYRATTTIDFSDLPYWDLCAALRPASKLAGWGLEADVERTMREAHCFFVAQALERLGS